MRCEPDHLSKQHMQHTITTKAESGVGEGDHGDARHVARYREDGLPGREGEAASERPPDLRQRRRGRQGQGRRRRLR